MARPPLPAGARPCDCTARKGSGGFRPRWPRRDFLRALGWFSAAGGLSALGARLGWGRPGAACPPGAACGGCGRLPDCASRGGTVWQLDPALCVQCGRCAENCVLTPSAVKCVHNFSICGYCRLCFGFFQPGAAALDESAENQMCPMGAIRRRFIEEPYYEYSVDESLCVGCAKCVKGCTTFGNGSLQLQARHDRCKNCNECAIARDCPGRAWRRVPASTPYLLKARA